MGTGELNARGNPVMDIQGGVEILPVASCYRSRNQDKFRPDRALGSYNRLDYTQVKTALISVNTI